MVPKRSPGPAHPEGWRAAQALMSHSTALAAHGKCRVAPASDPASSDTQNSCKQGLVPWDVSQPCLEREKEHHCPWSQLERVMVNPAQPGAWESSREPCLVLSQGSGQHREPPWDPAPPHPLICSCFLLGFHHQPHHIRPKKCRFYFLPFIQGCGSKSPWSLGAANIPYLLQRQKTAQAIINSCFSYPE